MLISPAMAIGGLLNSRRIAETTNHWIATMNHGRGFVSNLATGLLRDDECSRDILPPSAFALR